MKTLLSAIIALTLSVAVIHADDNDKKTKEQSRKQGLKESENIVKEINDMSRETKVNKKVEEHQAHQARTIQWGIKDGSLTEAEADRINAIEKKIDELQKKLAEDKKMSKEDYSKLMKELNTAYRALFFERLDNEGKPRQIILMGKSLTLKKEYQEKINKQRLSESESKDIMKTYWDAVSVRYKTDGRFPITPERQAQMKSDCFTKLSAYFEMTDVPEKKSADAEKKPAETKK